MKLRNLFFAALGVFAFAACSETPESPYNPGGNTGGGGDNNGTTITGENLLKNSSFETWEGGKPTSWGMTVTNGSYTQSSEANTGNSAVLLSGNADANKRLASKSYTLKPGTYTLAAYFKQSGETLGQFRLGYAKLTNGVVADTQNDYIYLTSAAAVTSSWKQTSADFTLTENTEIGVIIMNSKYGNGAAILVDDVILTTVDGGIVEGTESDDTENTEKPEGTYIYETFSASLGDFATQQTVGNYPWINDYSTAKATSYDGADNEATSWLISPAVDFTEETEAYAAFEYIIRYSESGKVAENHQLLISADYKDDVATATWTDLPYNAVEGKDWSTFYKANINIPAEFLGKANITFAFRYTATTKAGTWEVRNFVVAHGKAEITETPDTPETPSEASEYTVTEALAAFVAGETKPAIVKGYIVGTIDGMSVAEGALFSGTATTATNLLLADNTNETDYTKCLPIQLPTGDVRTALNLVDNPGNYKKYVVLTGSLEKYFGVAGLKSVSAYTIDGVTPEEPVEPETPVDPETPVEPETPVVPVEGNILENNSFEEWNGNNPTAWGEGNIGHKSTISQSTEAYDGNYAVVVNGSTQNMRLASQSYNLPAGTYTISAYIKQSGSAAGAFKLGYGIIKGGAIENSDYKYQTNATTVTSEWTLYTYEFTLSQNTLITALVMNSKVGNGNAILVDNVTITAK